VADKQRLNSLGRFRKHSGRLVLEEHGHCEIPAGCGGVVLRWRDPRAAVHALVYCYTPGQATCWLDGAELQSGRVDLAPGRHVVAWALQAVERSAGLILFVATAPPEGVRAAPGGVAEPPLKVLSAADGTWRYSLDRPADDWAQPSFDAAGWPALVAVPAPSFAGHHPGAYLCRRCVHLGAACLGLPRAAGAASAGDVWIRKTFEVPMPATPDPRP
jgi:hypothetical protein